MIPAVCLYIKGINIYVCVLPLLPSPANQGHLLREMGARREWEFGRAIRESNRGDFYDMPSV